MKKFLVDSKKHAWLVSTLSAMTPEINIMVPMQNGITATLESKKTDTKLVETHKRVGG